MMNRLLLFLALPLAVLGLDCAGKSDGNYFIGCKSFGKCVHGVITVEDCHEGMVYDSRYQTCKPERTVPAPCGLKRDCLNIPDGSYADLMLHCKSYYTCEHHVYYGHNFCTPGTVFDNRLRTCVWPRDALPPCGTKGVSTTPSG